jgi:PAS domain S-box-containing protein
MDDTKKTAEQLLEEIYSLRKRIAELEASEAELSRIRKYLDRGSESLRLLVEESLDATGVVDGHGVIRYMSPSIEKMTGYAVEELIGKSVFDYVHPDDIVELQADFSRGTMTLAQTYKRQFRYLHADGSWHVVESTGINLLEDPAVAGLVVTARDITKRIMVEKSLKESEARYRALIESQGVGICEIDNEERFKFANAEAHNILGVPDGELPGRSLREFMDDENFQIVRGQTRLREEGVRNTYDVAIRRPSGERRILRVTATPRLDENGKMVASLGVFSDITEGKEAEEARERSERYYRSLIRYAGDMITIVDADLRFRWGSPTAGRITGHDPSSIYGKPLLDYIHPDDIAAARGNLESIKETPGASFTLESRFRHSDGSYHFHAVMVTNLLEDAAVRGLVINSRDINERKLMEEELLARNQELDAFARTVAHDLRTPLSLIEGYAQLLQEGKNSYEEEKYYLVNIVNAVRHMDELTESLLEYAQVGHSGGEIAAVESGEVVQEVLLQQATMLEQNNIEIEVKKGLPVVMVDEIKLRQVFANLLDNAIKYIGNNGDPRIEIGTRPAEGEVIFYLKDNGRGIKEEQQSEIFQPFKRFAGSASRGLGIGLSTVKLAVQGWGGRIWVESSPGQGSTFLFTAPL